MKKLIGIFLLVVLIGGVLLLHKSTRKDPIYIGAWTAGLWNNETKTVHPERLKTLENQIGKKVSIAHIYKGWQELDYPSTNNDLQILDDNNWTPLISANPYFFKWCQSNGGASLYKTIASGACDSFLHKVAKRLHTFNKNVFLRFAWEMNIPSNDWSLEKTHSTPYEYVAAWRHMHDVFVEEGATNVVWVYCPNVKTPASIDFSVTYPGDGYVDWIGLDGYNWGTTQSWSAWQSFHTVFSDSYQELSSIAPEKPFMIGEVGTTEQGGDKAAWYTDMLSNELLQSFPRVKAVILYDENRESTEHVNWKIDSSNASLNGFRNGIHNPVYSSDPVFTK